MVKIISGNSNVTISGIAGDAYVKTTFGLVKASRIGGSFTAENSNGGVTGSSIKGAANVRTSFASVILDGVSGGVDVYNQNGSIEVSGLAARTPGSLGCNSIPQNFLFSYSDLPS